MTIIEPQCVDALPQEKTINHYLRKYYYGVLFWMYVNVWCRYFYRHVMKLLHKCNLHYMAALMPYDNENTSVSKTLLGDVQCKKQYLRCSWCGLGGYLIKYEHTS